MQHADWPNAYSCRDAEQSRIEKTKGKNIEWKGTKKAYGDAWNAEFKLTPRTSL